MNSQVWWFVARSSGIVGWALLTASVVWGLLLSTKVSSTRIAASKLRPAWLLDLHRHLGGLAVIFTLIHLAGLVADSYVTFGWAEILLPMASEWKPGAVAFGVVSMYLLFAIEATSLAIRRLPRSLWRWVHRSSFVLYVMATSHGVAAGTDADNRWFQFAAWVSVVIVCSLTLRLVVVLRRRPSAALVRPIEPPATLAATATATAGSARATTRRFRPGARRDPAAPGQRRRHGTAHLASGLPGNPVDSGGPAALANSTRGAGVRRCQRGFVWRRRSRARARWNLTVPLVSPSRSAISSMLRSST